MSREHHYAVEVQWAGNRGTGTSGYSAYDRDHVVAAAGKPTISGSADPAFRGDAARWNPEELLVVALAQCHMLWYLHLAAVNGIVVLQYRDAATGRMIEDADGSGKFAVVVLKPEIVLAPGSARPQALALHDQAHEKCFIARSVNFPVMCEPSCIIAAG